ncbi:hypothetical protein ECEC1736_3446, partial [Escherichia coli EC1736]|jgi:ATP-dependent RNA helicase DOB1
MILI